MPAAADAEETNVHEATDATDSSSSDSADSITSSQSSSNGGAVNSAVSSSSRLPAAADGGRDNRIANEPTATDVPNSTAQDVQPNGSVGLSLADIYQMQQDRRPRISSSSSSSSEYSSL